MEIEREAKDLIIQVIRKCYPNHIIINEESNDYFLQKTDVQWIIDPLDATINFIKSFPHFAISIAVRNKSRIEVAVVYDPIRNELFTATQGQGCKLNGYRLRVSNARNLDGTILATGYPCNKENYAQNYISLVTKLFLKSANFRCTGSTALDLAYVAAGRIDGFFKISLKPWTFAVGELLLREAGGLVSDFKGNHSYVLTGNIVAGNPRVVKAILLTIRET